MCICVCLVCGEESMCEVCLPTVLCVHTRTCWFLELVGAVGNARLHHHGHWPLCDSKLRFQENAPSQLLTHKISTERQCVLLCWRDGIKYQPKELCDSSLPFLTAIVCKLTQPVLSSVLTPHHAYRALPHRSSSPSFFAARAAPNYSASHASSCLLLREPQDDTPHHHAPGADAWRKAVVCPPVDELRNTDKVSTWMLTLQFLGPCSHSQTLEATVLVKRWWIQCFWLVSESGSLLRVLLGLSTKRPKKGLTTHSHTPAFSTLSRSSHHFLLTFSNTWRWKRNYTRNPYIITINIIVTVWPTWTSWLFSLLTA